MKMITGFRISLICILVLLIFSVQGRASDLSVEDFSRLPKIRSVRISPDGKKLMYFQNVKDKTALVSLNIATHKMKTISHVDNVNLKFNYAIWANNDLVLFCVVAPYYRGGVPTYETRLLIRKADASEPYRELVKPGAVSSSDPGRFAQFQDNIVSLLPDDPDHILMAMDYRRPGCDTIYKVNLNNSDIHEFHPYMKDVRQWATDQQERIRFGVKSHRNTITFIVYDLDKKDWKEIYKKEVSLKNPPARPLGFAKDPNILYFRDDYNGRDAIYKADVSKDELKMELVAKDDKYDISGSLIYSNKTRDVVGVHHGEAEGEKIFWDEEFKKFQEAIDKALPNTVNYLVDFSDDDQRYIVYSTNSTTPGIYYLGDRKNNTLDMIGHTYPQLERKLQGSKKVTYNARDGKEIEAYLTLPENHNPGTPIPAVILPHGGPTVRDYGDFDYWAEFFANKGLLVLQPNFRGSSGYGKEFKNKALQNYGLIMQDDITDAANWLIKEKMADPERIAIVGGSYGGYAALMGAVKTPDLFRCAISFAGLSDLSSFVKSFKAYSNYQTVREQFGTDKKKLNASSPKRHVEKIKIPILLGHGDEDRTVPVDQSRQMAKALKKKKKVFTYVELKNGDHGLTLQKNRRLFFKAMDEFLDKYLLN